MKSLETLLSRRWILKKKDTDTYFFLRDELPKIKPFLLEKLGYHLIVNSNLIKLEKIPAKAENSMGINSFKNKFDYVIFLYVLSFLEEKEAEEQFVLSELTEFLEGSVTEDKIDWTDYKYRKILIRVMKFIVAEGMLEVNDGNEEGFIKEGTGEVLYENTGVSRYFVRNFTRDIMDFKTASDFQFDEWIDVNEDRGIFRRQRVYRKLLMSIGMYRSPETEEEFNYIRNFRNIVNDDLTRFFDCELHIHRNSAFIVLGESSRLGKVFPGENTLSDIVLLFNGMVLERIESGELKLNEYEDLLLDNEKFEGLLSECKEKFHSGFIKSYRELTTKEFVKEMVDYMLKNELIEFKNKRVLIRQVVAKVMGAYPKSFKLEEVDE